MDSNGKPDHPLSSVTEGGRDLCARCRGPMVVDHHMDLLDDTGQIDVTVWRCTSCGEVIDPTILRNRGERAPNLLCGTKQRKYAQRVGERESPKVENRDSWANHASGESRGT